MRRQPVLYQQGEGDRERQVARGPHHAGADLLVGQCGKAARPVRQVRVGGVQRVLGERKEDRQTHVRQHGGGHVADAARVRSRERGARGAGHLVPEEDPGYQEGAVREEVRVAVAQRQVVGAGQVPEHEVDAEHEPCAGRAGQRAEEPADRRAGRRPGNGPGDRPPDPWRERPPERDPRPAERDQRCGGGQQQKSLDHLRPEQLVRERVHWRGERDQDGQQAGVEGERALTGARAAGTAGTGGGAPLAEQVQRERHHDQHRRQVIRHALVASKDPYARRMRPAGLS